MSYEIKQDVTDTAVKTRLYHKQFTVAFVDHVLNGKTWECHLRVNDHDLHGIGGSYDYLVWLNKLMVHSKERSQVLQRELDNKVSLQKNLGKILNTTFEKKLVGQAVEDALEEQLKKMGWTPPEE